MATCDPVIPTNRTSIASNRSCRAARTRNLVRYRGSLIRRSRDAPARVAAKILLSHGLTVANKQIISRVFREEARRADRVSWTATDVKRLARSRSNRSCRHVLCVCIKTCVKLMNDDNPSGDAKMTHLPRQLLNRQHAINVNRSNIQSPTEIICLLERSGLLLTTAARSRYLLMVSGKSTLLTSFYKIPRSNQLSRWVTKVFISVCSRYSRKQDLSERSERFRDRPGE